MFRPLKSSLLAPSIVAVVLVASVAFAAPADAHAAYKDSDPPDESTVSDPPAQVWAEFTEPVTADSHLEVYDPCGAQVDRHDSSATGYRVTVSMTADKAGTYRVRFAVISSLDGHPTSGEFTFTSTGGASCGGAADQQPAQDSVAGRDRPGGRVSSGPRQSAPDAGSARVGGDVKRAAPGERLGAMKHPKAHGKRQMRGGLHSLAQRFRNADPEDFAPEERGVWDGLPLGAFAVGLLLAALIGAAGGTIYIGIVGPARR